MAAGLISPVTQTMSKSQILSSHFAVLTISAYHPPCHKMTAMIPGFTHRHGNVWQNKSNFLFNVLFLFNQWRNLFPESSLPPPQHISLPSLCHNCISRPHPNQWLVWEMDPPRLALDTTAIRPWNWDRKNEGFLCRCTECETHVFKEVHKVQDSWWGTFKGKMQGHSMACGGLGLYLTYHTLCI